jgi:hypothetical protein
MNLNKETPHTKSEKAAVRELIEFGMIQISPQKSSLPNLDSWVLQHLPTLSKSNKENQISSKVKKRVKLIPPSLKPLSTSVRNSSSLNKSVRESHSIRIPLASIPLPNNPRLSRHLSKPNQVPDNTNSLKPLQILQKSLKPRSHSVGEGKSNDRQMEIPEIRKALFSLILKNNLLSKFKSEETRKTPSNREKFDLRSLKIYTKTKHF